MKKNNLDKNDIRDNQSFVVKYHFIINQLLSAFLISTLLVFVFTLLLSVYFTNVHQAVHFFLKTKIFISQRALNIISISVILFGFALIFLSIVKFVVCNIFDKSLDKSEPRQLTNQNQKNQFLAFTYGGLGFSSLISIFFLRMLANLPNVTLGMVILLWIIIYCLVLEIKYCIFILIDWLSQDNQHDGNLPRTTIFWGFIATIVSTCLASILKR